MLVKIINNLPEITSEGENYHNNKELFAKRIFDLYQTHGFPLELILEELKSRNFTKFKEDEIVKIFDEELKKHQELSRTASVGMFKGGLADTSEATKKYHTAAHLMLAALRKVLGPHVIQKGSNITPQRLRFDFSHTEKMTDEQKKQVEDLVNEAIQKDLPVVCDEMSLEEAKKQVGTIAEGANSVQSVYDLIQKNNLNCPVITAIWRIVICGDNPGVLIEALGFKSN
jgi:alanyl-tRNA synthetase